MAIIVCDNKYRPCPQTPSQRLHVDWFSGGAEIFCEEAKMAAKAVYNPVLEEKLQANHNAMAAIIATTQAYVKAYDAMFTLRYRLANQMDDAQAIADAIGALMRHRAEAEWLTERHEHILRQYERLMVASSMPESSRFWRLLQWDHELGQIGTAGAWGRLETAIRNYNSGYAYVASVVNVAR